MGASHRWPVIQCCHNMSSRLREQQTKANPWVSLRGGKTRGILSSSLWQPHSGKKGADYDEDELRRMVRLSLPENTHIMMMDRP